MVGTGMIGMGLYVCSIILSFYSNIITSSTTTLLLTLTQILPHHYHYLSSLLYHIKYISKIKYQ